MSYETPIQTQIRYGYRYGHGDTAKLKNTGHGTRHAYTIYISFKLLTNKLSTNTKMNLIYQSNIKKSEKW